MTDLALTVASAKNYINISAAVFGVSAPGISTIEDTEVSSPLF